MAVDVKAWMASVPSVDAARPAHCPRCRIPSRVPGRALSLHGHGLIERTLWGPTSSSGRPGFEPILIRRFRCLACDAISMVGPGGVLHRRRYGGSAIAVAIALWCVLGFSQIEVRRHVSPWRIFGHGAFGRWRTLRRWLDDACAGRLWRGVGSIARAADGRADGERVLQQLVAGHSAARLGGLTAELAFAAGAHAR